MIRLFLVRVGEGVGCKSFSSKSHVSHEQVWPGVEGVRAPHAPSRGSATTANMTADNRPLERVFSFKLLEITLSNDLCLSCHVKEIYASLQTLAIFKLLKRSAMAIDDLLHSLIIKR